MTATETVPIGRATPAATNLPDEFWAARERLTAIRLTAHAAARSGDAVLAGVLTRISAATDPAYALPAIVGSRGSLNMFAAIIGATGSGKTTGKNIASELVPMPDHEHIIDDLKISSGEGIAEAFMGEVTVLDADGKKVRERRQVNRAAFAYVDEGSILRELGDRKGSTLLTTLRSAWAGETLGQDNASAERKRRIPAHKYRFALLAGFQMEAAQVLLQEANLGTPQRFMWMNADDSCLPTDEADLPRRPAWKWTPPPVPNLNGVPFSTEIGFPTEVRRQVRQADLDVNSGRVVVDVLDAHRNLMRMKVSALLALLGERCDTNMEDWALAGVVMDASRAVMDTVAAEGRRLAKQAETRRIVHKAFEADQLNASAEFRAKQKMAGTLARFAWRHPGPRTRRELQQATGGKGRELVTVDDAIEYAERQDMLRPVDGKWEAGSYIPE